MKRGNLDDLLGYLLEEIALYGQQGVSPSDVLGFLDNYVAQFNSSATRDASSVDGNFKNTKTTRSADRLYQNQVWTWLTRHPDICIGNERQGNSMSLSQVEEYNDGLNVRKQALIASAESAIQSNNEEQQLAQNENVSQVEPVEERTTPPITSGELEDSADPKLPLRVYASENRIWFAITGHGPDLAKVPGLDWKCLLIIAAHREKGVLQPDLVRLSDQDKRSVPGRTARLHKRGYIVKSAVQGKGLPTSLCVLKRFAPKSTHIIPMTSQVEVGNSNILENKLLSDDRSVNPYRYTQESILLMKPLIERMLVMLTEARIMPLHELKIELGISTMGWASKVLAIVIRRLEILGFVQRIRMGLNDDGLEESRFKRRVRLLRDPDEEGLGQAYDLTKRLKSQTNATEEGDESAEDDLNEEHALGDYIDMPPPGPTGFAPQNERKPIWDADKPIGNMLYNLVNSSGSDGITSAELKESGYGIFFQRPVEHYMDRLVECWQVSQPLHLRHLAIVRESQTIERVTQYRHYTFDSFKTLADRGEKLWAAVEKLKEVRKANRAPKVSADAVAELDEYGFPLLPQSKFEGDNKDATYAECIEAANVTPFRLTQKDPMVVKRADGSNELLWVRSGPNPRRSSGTVGSSRKASGSTIESAVKRRSAQPKMKPKSVNIGRPRLFPKSTLPSYTSRLSKKQLARVRQSQVAAKNYRKKKFENEIENRMKENGESYPKARIYVIAHFRARGEDLPLNLEFELPKQKASTENDRRSNTEKGSRDNKGKSSLPKPYYPSTVAHAVWSLLGSSLHDSKVRRRRKARAKKDPGSTIGYLPSIVAHGLRIWRSASVKTTPTFEENQSQSLDNLDHGDSVGAVAPRPIKAAPRSRKRSAKAADLDENANLAAKVIVPRPQKRAKMVAPLTSDSNKKTYSEQASDITRDVPGIYVGRQTQLKKRGSPKSRLAIFRSTRLGEKGWFSVDPHAQSNPVVAQTVTESFSATVGVGQPFATAGIAILPSRSRPGTPNEASINTLITLPGPQASLSNSDKIIRGKTCQSRDEDGDSTMIDHNTGLEGSEAALAQKGSDASNAPPIPSEQTIITSGHILPAPEIMAADLPLSDKRKRKRTVKFALEAEHSGLEPSNETSTPAEAKRRRRSNLPSVEQNSTPTKRVYKRNLKNGSSALTPKRQQRQRSSMPSKETSLALSTEVSFHPSLIVKLSFQRDPISLASALSRLVLRTNETQEKSGDRSPHPNEDTVSMVVEAQSMTSSQSAEFRSRDTRSDLQRSADEPEAPTNLISPSTDLQDTSLDVQETVEKSGTSAVESQLVLPEEINLDEDAIMIPPGLTPVLPLRDETSLESPLPMTPTELVSPVESLESSQAPLQKTWINQQAAQAGTLHSLSLSSSNIHGRKDYVSPNSSPGRSIQKSTFRKLSNIRRSIILEIIEKCGGVFPGEKELFYPFNTAWFKLCDTQKQEQEKIKKAVKQLVDSNLLRRQWFTINNRQGVPVARCILTLGTIPPTDPKIKETLENIAACGSRLYVPKEVEVLKTLKRVNELVRHGTQDLELENGEGEIDVKFVSRAERRKIAREFLAEKNRDPEAEKQKHEKAREELAAKDERNKKRKLEDEETRKMIQDRREKRAAKRIADQERPRKYRKIERTGMSDKTSQRGRVGKGFQQTGNSNPDGPSIDYQSFQSFLREENRPDDEISPLDGKRYSELSRMTWEDADQEPSTLMDPQHLFHPSTGTFSVIFSGFQKASSGVLSLRKFSGKHGSHGNHSTTYQRGGRKLASARGTSTVVPAKRQRKIPYSKLKTRRLFTLQDKIAHASVRELPKVPDGNTFKSIRTRGPTRSSYLKPEDERRIMIAVIIVRTLIGGVEQNIDWTFLSIILPEFSKLFIHKSWTSLRQKYKVQIHQIMNSFQEMFSYAYENDLVPSLDYDNLLDYDWNWLIDWTNKNLDTPMQSLPDLPESRAQLDDLYVLQEQPRKDTIDLYETDGTVSMARRYTVAHREPCAAPVESSQPRTTVTPSEHDITKSLIKSNVITPDETYNPSAARSKFDSFDQSDTLKILKGLISDKVIISGNKGRVVPGRTYDISDNFIRRFRKPALLQMADYKRALIYKNYLDTSFEEHGTVNFSPLADDGAVCVILNLLAHGRISIRPSNPPMKEFGFMTGHYMTRFMDKSNLSFAVTLTPTPSYQPGNPLLPLALPPPRRHPADKDLDLPRSPVWYDINGDLSLLWDLALAPVLGVLSVRPGVTKVELERSLKEGLEIWELECMMKWLVDVGAAAWVGEEKDMEGVVLKEWWWSVVGAFPL